MDIGTSGAIADVYRFHSECQRKLLGQPEVGRWESASGTVDPEALRPRASSTLAGWAWRTATPTSPWPSVAWPARLNGQYGPHGAGRFFSRYMAGGAVDNAQVAFYCLLDEFF